MTATGFRRGHRITWDGQNWCYDDGATADTDRPCPSCHEMPTPEGYDACIGELPGAISVCCGHGMESAYMVRRAAQQVIDLVARDSIASVWQPLRDALAQTDERK